jgi:hypothetical protein
MPRNTIISALLIVTLATSASACVEGVGSSSPGLCAKSSRPSCGRNLKAVGVRRCNPGLKSVPAHCEIRGLVQFHLVAFTKFEVPSPLRIVSRIFVLSRQGPGVSSIGSPETDRGPPLS